MLLKRILLMMNQSIEDLQKQSRGPLESHRIKKAPKIEREPHKRFTKRRRFTRLRDTIQLKAGRPLPL
jgi:hypothetical protein